jgi:selenide,water dikinase
VDLAEMLKHLKPKGNVDPNLLVGFDTSDDAGVYKLSSELALVQTIDFITPTCDDPFLFGQIAAANSLSDVYAMGGRPLNALNVCCFPQEGAPPEVLAEILKGGDSKVQEAGAIIVGGHTVTDNDLKYGLSVTGLIHPDRVVRNSTCKPGDKIVLTKKIGTGVIINSFKADVIAWTQTEEAMKNMLMLNKVASEAMLEIGVHACTDISGFGLARHLCEMAIASRVAVRLAISSIPVYPISTELFGKGIRTGMTMPNKHASADYIVLEREWPREKEMALYDPQTSGPLAISVHPEKADQLVSMLRGKGHMDAAIIGEVVESSQPRLLVSDSL